MSEVCTKVNINGIDYVRSDLIARAEKDGLPYAIIRTQSAGVWAGYIKSRVGQEVVLLEARRMWRWFGASLSQIAQEGCPVPANCMFPCPVARVELLQVIEIDYCTGAAMISIQGVPVWKK
jgi:hypothetical protein